jgi:hypothetical protein
VDEQLSKRRLNEFEQKLRRLQRELQELKSLKRKVSRMRKEQVKTNDREVVLTELLEFPEPDHQDGHLGPRGYTCRRPGCGSHDTDQIEAGTRIIVVCQTCRGRYTLTKMALAG